MHIPDGFLTVNTWAPAWLISAAGLGYCFRKAGEALKEKTVPLMGVMSAFIFAAQMLNFPVVGGTSGHLLGGVLASVLLGPYIGAITIACVLITQCLIFQDGGVTSLGANILNMSFIGAMAGYFVYALIRKVLAGDKGIILGAFFAGWLSVILASAGCAIELSLSGTSPFNIVFPAMIGIHALIGIGEAVITVFVLGFIIKVRPDLIGG